MAVVCAAGFILGFGQRSTFSLVVSLVDDARRAPMAIARPSLAGLTSGVGLFAVVAAFTAGIAAHLVSVGLFASSATRIAAGKVWLLLTSALIVDRPIAVGLAAFGVIALVTVWVCGARTFWVAALAGHVGSTLAVYGIIGLARIGDPDGFAGSVGRPDFGVSAMQGAWVGALTAYAWLWSGPRLRPRAATVAAVCALTGVAWLLHPDPSILTFEHPFAFFFGASVVCLPWRWPVLRRVSAAVVARVRSAPVSFGYLLVLFATTAWLTTETGRDADAALLSRSTNLHNLAHDPVRVIVASAFWLSDSWRPLCTTAVLLAGLVAPLEWAVGSRRTASVLGAGHVGATLLTAVGLWAAVGLGSLAPSVERARDVGPSYAIYAAAAALTYRIAPRWRLPYLAALLAWVAVPGVVAGGFTDVGHGLAVAVGLACHRIVRNRSGVGRPGFDPHLLRQERRAPPLELPALRHTQPPRTPDSQLPATQRRGSA